MATFGEQLARLRVAAVTGTLPRDVAAWAIEELEELAPAGERIAARNELLRRAGECLTGSLWAKSRRLEREIQAAGSRLRQRSADVDGVRDLVARALEVDPDLPRSPKHLRRILRGAC